MSEDADTDICGYPTDQDGSPCQNPAGENGRCWQPKHNPEDSDPRDIGGDPGRPSKFTYKRAHEAIEAAREGFSKAGCARAAGVDEATLYRWLDSEQTLGSVEFRSVFMRARHEGEKELVSKPLDAPDDMDTQHARFLLSTSYDYVKTEKREITGEDGGPVEVDRSLAEDEKAMLEATLEDEPET